MKIIHNVSLKEKTTIRIGGMVTNFYIPESRNELIGCLKTLDDIYLIGGGSNLLINDKKQFDNFISLKEFDKSVDYLGDGRFYCGASITMPRLCRDITKYNCGGISYLASVPGLLGGVFL